MIGELHQVRARVKLFPVHFPRTFSLQCFGPYDPTAELTHDLFRKAFFYDGEACAVEIFRENDGVEVVAHAPDASISTALLEEMLRGLSQNDSYNAFPTEDSGVLRLHRLFPGLRLLRMPWLYDLTCSTILQQRIRSVDAMSDWRRIAVRYGIQGPLGLKVFPSAEMLARVPMFALQQMGMDMQRARTLLRFAQESRFVPLKPQFSFDQLRDRLLRVPGIGPWTTESVLGYGAGDTDAAIPGDLHLPRILCYALAGEMNGSDERMMELLEPFRGHRFRVIRLMYAARIDVPH